MKKKNAFFTFCFSFIPGAGQMYQNYMKRGISIMTLFASFAALAIMLSTPIFIVPALVVYAYSFFDTFNIRNKEKEEDEPHDEYIWKKILGENNFDIKIFRKNKLLGIILVLIGIYLLFNNVLLNIAYHFDMYMLEKIIIYVSRYLPALVISLLSIFVGMKILVGKEK